MVSPSGRILQRIRVGGIKLSPELAQFTYTRPTAEKCFFNASLESIAHQNINISYLSLSCSENSVSTSFCVANEYLTTVQGILSTSGIRQEYLLCISSVGSLTIFPHRNNLSMLGRVLRIFGSYKLPVFGVCTSVSALSVITRYSDLENATIALEGILELPENHSPFRQEFNIQQINIESGRQS